MKFLKYSLKKNNIYCYNGRIWNLKLEHGFQRIPENTI